MKEREVMGNIVSPSFKILKTWQGIADVVLRATCVVSEILCEVLELLPQLVRSFVTIIPNPGSAAVCRSPSKL